MDAPEVSQAVLFASLPPEDRAMQLALLSEDEALVLSYSWRYWARPKQLPPPGDWGTWLIRGGRGSGKTRSGSGFFHERALAHPGRWMALVGRTPADVRDYCIDGPGGLLRNTPPDQRPHYEVSKRRLTWPNGSWATIYSDEEPDQVRGFSGDTAWLDEFAKFKHARDTWDNLEFGMREPSGDRPRRAITTTPRPLKILQEIEAFDDTIAVIMSSYENRLNLDPTYYKKTIARYEGTRLGRQEIHAEYLLDVPNAMWTQAMLDTCRIQPGDRVPDMQRVVIGVDPSGTKGSFNSTDMSRQMDVRVSQGDEIGIVAVGLGTDGIAYVLGDYSCNLGPAGWGKRVVHAYDQHDADRVVAERNYGGAMVEFTIKTVDDTVSYKDVNASRGKEVRAEPIAALYEQGRVKHVEAFPELEDQMLGMTTKGFVGERSPDRLDAQVWAITELKMNPVTTMAFSYWWW